MAAPKRRVRWLLGVSAGFWAAAEVPAEDDLLACAEKLFDGSDLKACRVTLLRAFVRDEIPGYHYSAQQDCHFWAQFAVRDRRVEFSRELAFPRLMDLRLTEPFEPPLRRNGTMLYVGAHRAGEDGLHIHRSHGLRIHFFEPSPTFFGELRETVGNGSAFSLHNYGLGLTSRDARLRLDGQGSATLGEFAPPVPGQEARVRVRAAAEVVEEIAAAEVGGDGLELLHVNCEGCEYDVVRALHEADRLTDFAHVQLATHLLHFQDAPAGVPEAGEDEITATASMEERNRAELELSAKRYCEAHGLLAETHERVWGIPWVWERWSRRSACRRPESPLGGCAG